MNTPIELTDDLFIAKGMSRACYSHPSDNGKVIKIYLGTENHGKVDSRDPNIIEKTYLEAMQKRHGKIAHLPEYYGEVDTNLGKSYIFEKITDANGEVSKTLHYYLQENILNFQQAEQIIYSLYRYFLNKKIAVIDRNLQNIALKILDNGEFLPVLIDGFGASTLGFALNRNIYLPLYSKFKTKKFMKSTIKRMPLWYDNQPTTISNVNIKPYVRLFTTHSEYQCITPANYIFYKLKNLKRRSRIKINGINNNAYYLFKLKNNSSLNCNLIESSQNNHIHMEYGFTGNINIEIRGNNNLIYIGRRSMLNNLKIEVLGNNSLIIIGEQVDITEETNIKIINSKESQYKHVIIGDYSLINKKTSFLINNQNKKDILFDNKW